MRKLIPISIIIVAITVIIINQVNHQDTNEVRLPKLSLDFKKLPNADSKEKCVISFTHFSKGDSVVLFTDSLSKFKLRGDPNSGGARSFKKKSYTIKLSSKRKMGNLPADKDWILNANYIDKSFMRHKLSYDLFRSLRQENIAPKCDYVEVYLNGKYNGLYVIMERPDRKLFGVKKKDSLSCLFKDPPIFYDPKTNIPSRKGKDNLYWQKYPSLKKRNMNYLVKELSEFIYHSSDSIFKKDINKWVDIDNIIDWHINLMFCNNNTGHRKNFYLYKTKSTEPFRIGLWDSDRGFGRDDDNEKNSHFFKGENMLTKRLIELNAANYVSRLKARWEAQKKSKLSERTILKKIQSNYENFKPGLNKNFKKWPIDAKIYFDSETTEMDIELMKKFIHIRYTEMDEYLESISKK